MAETSRIECRTCRHIGALHAPNGCRLNGCRCAEFTDGSPRPRDAREVTWAAREKEWDARIAKWERLTRFYVLVILVSAAAAILLVVLR